MTFQQHLDDLKWLFMERGLQTVHAWLQQFADATIDGNVTGAKAIGAIEMEAAASPGLHAALENTIKPSGRLNLVSSTALEFGDGAKPQVPPSNFRS